MKAVILTRVSTKEQEDKHSLPAQLSRLTEYGTRRNFEIIRTFQIVESSTQGDRKKFKEVLDFCKRQKEPIAIIADAVDRVQRSFKESVQLDELVRAEKIELHFMRESMVIGKNASAADIMRWDFAVVGAKSYVLQLAENVKRSINHKHQNGEWSGLAPIGYRNYRDQNNKSQIVIDEQSGPIIKKLFEIYSLGGCSFKELLKKADDMGLRSRFGNKLAHGTLYNTFQNPFYYGVMRVKGKLLPHKYEPLISKELWDRCQAVQKKITSKPFRSTPKPFLYRGLITCANTGKICTLDSKKNDRLHYIICYDKAGKRQYIPEEVIDRQICTILDSICYPDKLLDEMRSYIKTSKDAEIAFREQSLKELNKELSIVQNRIDNLFNLVLDNKIDSDMYQLKMPELKNQKHLLEAKIAAHAKADEAFNDEIVFMYEGARNAGKTFRESSNIEQKRLLLKTIIRTLELDCGKVGFDLRFPFFELQELSNPRLWRSRHDSNVRPTA